MKVTSAQVVETSANVASNSPSEDYTHLDDHNLHTYILVCNNYYDIALATPGRKY